MLRPPHSLNLTIVLISEYYKLFSRSLCNFLQSPVTSSLLGRNICIK
jgi:hypothetical protein